MNAYQGILECIHGVNRNLTCVYLKLKPGVARWMASRKPPEQIGRAEGALLALAFDLAVEHQAI